MPILDASSSHLLLIDFQARLMPAIHDGDAVTTQASKLLSAARLLDLPRSYTEQNSEKLGGTVTSLAPEQGETVLSKMSFDACRDSAVAEDLSDNATLIVAGCEAHVCVLQTVLGLLDRGKRVAVAADATGSRTPANRDAALARMAAHGAEIVTTEMVLFEWLGTAEHSKFRDIKQLIK
ncbi:MAG: isochorismatase family protein [Roseovarius sp.]|jgi:nicotinamidase-related amidase|uniref:isochorismatase family protein n=1 Tax=Roseovarius sp. TaxID=1486281 RepID=UPI0032EF6F3A